MSNWFEVFERVQSTIVESVVARLRSDVAAYSTMPVEDVRRRALAGLLPYAHDLDEPEPRHFAAYWSETAYERSRQGIPLDAFLQVLLLATEETLHGLGQALSDVPAQQLALLRKGYAVSATGIAAVYEGYSRHKDEIIAAQTVTLGEIAAPIVPIYEEILVVPLIGTLNAARATQIMEALLEAIGEKRADVVLIDITGVPVIDTAVANYLVQTARAASLLGATVVLVGTRAEIAQTIVQLGADLSGIISRANLQAGIEYALETKGLAIAAAQATPGS
jgi:rsbT co-antagonist protein RsbR